MQIKQVYFHPGSTVGLESYRVCWLQPTFITRLDRRGLKRRCAPLWFPRPRDEIISHRLTNYLWAENKASTRTSHSQQAEIKNTES